MSHRPRRAKRISHSYGVTTSPREGRAQALDFIAAYCDGAVIDLGFDVDENTAVLLGGLAHYAHAYAQMMWPDLDDTARAGALRLSARQVRAKHTA
ncbi:MAG: hypothetical protein CME34_08405 [Gordonia sp.]|uniref:hypothetical protein n=1 Tax=Gordonia sp. (in: high G+C Gram-positive bacteria) TaxID=84139 RepID=UPI000C37BFBD|nr:hypothetical protein [Gordonia sp. (in: high G+C Gram-positive bacteria)]MAU81878.1 hypothetical protein [Gordonia sp. (in: high G+C Gram-positive bacteria)]